MKKQPKAYAALLLLLLFTLSLLTSCAIGAGDLPSGGEPSVDAGEPGNSADGSDPGDGTETGENTPGGEEPDSGEDTTGGEADAGIPDREDAIYASSIVTLPTVGEDEVYVGQPLSAVSLLGGEGNVAGVFVWEDPKQSLAADGTYTVAFIPDDTAYSVAYGTLTVQAVQLTVTVSAGENGTADPIGTWNVNYGEAFSVTFRPDPGYAVGSVEVDGTAAELTSGYTFENITASHTVCATFRESDLALTVTCLEGTDGCYSIAGSTLTFTALSQDSVYAVSGELVGNIVIDVGDAYQFELEMQGLTVWCGQTSPIAVVSGDKVTLTAKKNYENYIYDLREAVAEEDESQYAAAIYSAVDLDIGGKGSLTVLSEHNKGIHTKDDLEVKNLTLSVTCTDNALKGNDSVTVKSGTLNLIATAGDGIKTSNTDISDKGNQRGTVRISGGTVRIYAACDGIDAAYDIVIDESEDTVVLEIYTDQYSEYSEDVTVVSEDAYYIRFTSKNYTYSIQYYNSDDDYKWVNAAYYTSVSSGRSTYYYYKFPTEAGYSRFRLFIYSQTQTQGQDTDYTVASDYLTWNTAYDTIALSQSGSSLRYSWTNYTSSSGMGGMGGMQDGNSDKGDYSTKGLKAGNEIAISAGTVTVQSYDDAIHANSDTVLENGASPTGNVSITGGTLTLSSNDDGIHADGTLTVSGGVVRVTKSYEGLEGTCVCVTGGDISVVSSDDGINATATSGTGIAISGGTVYVYAGGDGLDANSRTSYAGIVFSGGHTVVISTSSGNSAIDTEAGYQYTGGTVVAIMPSGGMSSESTNCSGFTGVGTKATVALSSGSYLTVTVDAETVVTVRMPCSLSALVIFLGSNGAGVAQTASAPAEADENGVCWN